MEPKKSWKVIIPQWENKITLSKKTKAKYWLWKHRSNLPKKYKDRLSPTPLHKGKHFYCKDADGNQFLKNTVKAGTPNEWVLNGQDLYNCSLGRFTRNTIVSYYHTYFGDFIKEQLTSPIIPTEAQYLSVSCDIYEIRRGIMPDVSNMWLLEKTFEDALQICEIITSDAPNIVRESGRKKYHWVDDIQKRQLVFNIALFED